MINIFLHSLVWVRCCCCTTKSNGMIDFDFCLWWRTFCCYRDQKSHSNQMLDFVNMDLKVLIMFGHGFQRSSIFSYLCQDSLKVTFEFNIRFHFAWNFKSYFVFNDAKYLNVKLHFLVGFCLYVALSNLRFSSGFQYLI